VLAALRELLAGFQAADEYTKGALLVDVLREAPQEVYGALLDRICDYMESGKNRLASVAEITSPLSPASSL
jgi:hypothetical protein